MQEAAAKLKPAAICANIGCGRKATNKVAAGPSSRNLCPEHYEFFKAKRRKEKRLRR